MDITEIIILGVSQFSRNKSEQSTPICRTKEYFYRMESSPFLLKDPLLYKCRVSLYREHLVKHDLQHNTSLENSSSFSSSAPHQKHISKHNPNIYSYNNLKKQE